MSAILANGKQQYFGDDGKFLNGGKLYTYQAGTLTPKATYQDAEATAPNTNPVILDTRGEATIFWVGSYDITLTDALDNVIYSVPGISEPTAEYRTSPVGSAVIPSGATSQRDDPAIPGYFRFNTDNNLFEGYVDAMWKSFQELLVSGVNIKTINGQSLLAAGDIMVPATLIESPRTAPSTIKQADLSTYITLGAGSTSLTFDNAAVPALEDGLWFIVENTSGGDISLLVSGTTLVDGMATYPMYPGEARLFRYRASDGTFGSTVMKSFAKRFLVGGNYTKPPGYAAFDLELVAGGAGGGGGESRAAGTARAGGAGGAGGARVARRIVNADLGPISNTFALAIGAGGAGGNGGNITIGGNGGAGGNTFITSDPAFGAIVLFTAYGGGPGMGGNGIAVVGGGSGGGSGSAGAVGAAAGAAGGLPANTGVNGGITAAVVNNWGGGGAGVSTTNSGQAEWGGAGGGGVLTTAGAGWAGGSSLWGGAGGGAGSSLSNTNVNSNGTNGGALGKYVSGAGGNAGLSAAVGFAGQAGGTILTGIGNGGGGGGSGAGGAGGVGGAGALGGGGGGGGGAGTSALGGGGGTGGAGYVDMKGVI